MSLTFGATTYTSVAKALQSALQEPAAGNNGKISRTLKGHLQDDKRIFTATLDKDSQGNDVVVILGDTQLPAGKALASLNTSIGYRQVIPARDAAKRIKSNLVGLLREAFKKAKAGNLPELEQFEPYIKAKTAGTVQHLLGKTIESRLGSLQGVKTLKDLEKLTSQVSDKQDALLSELESFKALENARLLKALSRGQLNTEQLAQYRDKVNTVVDSTTMQVSQLVSRFFQAQSQEGPLPARISDCQDKLKSLQSSLRQI